MVEGRGRPAGTTLEAAKGQMRRWQPLLPNLQRVNAAALATGRTRFTALLHHIDVAALERAFRRPRRAASPGVDRVTMDQYEQDLAGNLQRLHARVHSGQYWPKPVLRTYIPKADGTKRPLGQNPSRANFCATAPPTPQRTPTGNSLSSSVLPCASRVLRPSDCHFEVAPITTATGLPFAFVVIADVLLGSLH